MWAWPPRKARPASASARTFEYSLVGGLVASGADAYLLHVTTTPSVAYIARVDRLNCGVMISASHNPYYDNGIKLINGQGEKMDEGTMCQRNQPWINPATWQKRDARIARLYP